MVASVRCSGLGQMMMSLRLCAATLGLLSMLVTGLIWTSQATMYDGDEVLEVLVDGNNKLNNFSLIVNRFQVSLWQPPVEDTGKALVHVLSAEKEQLKKELETVGIAYRTVIGNLQTRIDRERQSNPVEGVALPWTSRTRNSRRKRSSVQSIVGKYATYEEIHDWLTDISFSFPNITRLEVIGKTFEGRDLLLLKIGNRSSESKNPAIWLDAGIHAREWITVSSAVYIISQILTNYYNGSSESLALSGAVDWYILPLVNPDGYAFTHHINGNRLWRKNRSIYVNSSYSQTYNRSCRGTDLNRNFDFMWNGEGATTEPCSETYRGPWPASENETQAIKNFLWKHNSSLHGYVTIHSFGQLFMVRWAYSNDAPPTPEFNDTLAVANEAVDAINRTSGVIYRTGTSPQILYPFTGGSGDWVRANTPIRHVYDVELRDRGEFGFVLPANYILPVGEELWEAIKVVATHVLRDHPPTTDHPSTTDHPLTTDHPSTTSLPVTHHYNGQVESLSRSWLVIFFGQLFLVVFVYTRWI